MDRIYQTSLKASTRQAGFIGFFILCFRMKKNILKILFILSNLN